MAEAETYSVDDFGGEETGQSEEVSSEDQVEVEGETAESDEVEIEVEGKGTKIESEDSKVSSLEAQIRELTNEVLKLSATKKEPVPDVVKPKTEERLTRGQLVQIMKEHADDPEVMLNVIDYLADQKTKEVRDETVKDLNYKQWHSNLAGTANRILAEDQDGYLKSNPQIKQQLKEAATNLGLSDHPVGELAAYAIMRLGEQVKGNKAPEKEVPNKGKMDKTKAKPPIEKTGLNADQLAMAKKFGVKPETYAQFVRKS